MAMSRKACQRCVRTGFAHAEMWRNTKDDSLGQLMTDISRKFMRFRSRNAEHPTPNVQCRTETGVMKNSQLSTLNHQLCRGVSLCALRQTTQSPSFGTLARERSEEHTSELQSRSDLVCRLLLEKKK